MWSFLYEQLPHGRGLRFIVHFGGQPATFADFIRDLHNNSVFRLQFSNELANVPYEAYRWETPAVTQASLGRPFECVAIDSPELVRRPEPEAFAEHFSAAPAGGVVTFGNLGGDAILVVPCPVGPASAYGHLGTFVRHASESQRDALWQSIGAAMQRRVSSKSVWLSTAGAGVAWLHVRLDDRPKYYSYAPYKQFSSSV